MVSGEDPVLDDIVPDIAGSGPYGVSYIAYLTNPNDSPIEVTGFSAYLNGPDGQESPNGDPSIGVIEANSQVTYNFFFANLTVGSYTGEFTLQHTANGTGATYSIPEVKIGDAVFSVEGVSGSSSSPNEISVDFTINNTGPVQGNKEVEVKSLDGTFSRTIQPTVGPASPFPGPETFTGIPGGREYTVVVTTPDDSGTDSGIFVEESSPANLTVTSVGGTYSQ